jgi:hypothetical protein
MDSNQILSDYEPDVIPLHYVTLIILYFLTLTGLEPVFLE